MTDSYYLQWLMVSQNIQLVGVLNFINAVIILKFEQFDYHRVQSPDDADRMANSVDREQSDLGLHCLP